MRLVDAIAHILKKENIKYLSCFPTTPVIEAAAAVGIRPIICRQERVGVGIADGYSRMTRGTPPGVFAMQSGPGAENAYAGVATAYSDSVPMLLLPLGHPVNRDGVFPNFSSVRSYESIVKSVEQINELDRVGEALRRAFARMKLGRPGPVMVEIPSDLAIQEVNPSVVEEYKPIETTLSEADPQDVLRAADMFLRSRDPLIYVGQGALYAQATKELTELAELLRCPVVTTMAGKGSIDERHPLALGSTSSVVNGAAYHYIDKADIIFAVGTSLTKHNMVTTIPKGKQIIHTTNDPIDVGNYYDVDHALLGDTRLVLRQFIDACKDIMSTYKPDRPDSLEEDIKEIHQKWLGEWMRKLASDETPITPYRVIWDFMNCVDPSEAIVTHDSGSPRDQIMPFYRSGGPGTYIGWGKSHGLGTGLGLNIGAKLAKPEKFVVNFMGDAAFGMTGLDFETAVRSQIPILTIVLNNSTMAIEFDHMQVSHSLYGTRDLGGNYAEMAKTMGGWAERVHTPADIIPAIQRARRITEEGQAALLEFVTSEEKEFSHRRPFA